MDDAATFREAVPAVETAIAVETGPSLHVYTGRLAGQERDVRFITTAPDAEPAIRKQFQRRVDQWEACSDQPTVLTVYDRGSSPRPWIAVDTVTGHRLTEIGSELTDTELLDVVADVADALHYAARSDVEQPIIAPEHVVISLDGVASGQLEWELPTADEAATPYTPPEARDDPAKARTIRASVYRLGAIAAAGLTGPLQATDANENVPEKFRGGEADERGRAAHRERTNWAASAEREAILNRVLATDPDGRYDSLYEFKRALLFDVPGTEQVERPATADADEKRTWLSRRRTLGLLGAGILGAGLLGGGGLFAAIGSREQGPVVRPLDGVGLDRYDAANTGVLRGGSGPTRGLQLLWRFEAADRVASSAAVVDTTTEHDGSGEHPDPATVFVGSHDGNVYALDAADGTKRWAVQTDGPVVSSPAVVGVDTDGDDPPGDGRVFVGSDDGTVYALDVADGTEHWTVDTGGPVRSSPTVVAETVYVGSASGTVYALDVADGTERWTVDTDGDVLGTPAVTSVPGRDRMVFLGDSTGTVHALAAETGDKRWEFRAEGPIQSAPAVLDGTVFVGSMIGLLYAIDAADGTERWRFETDGPIQSGPAVTARELYVGSHDGNVYALDVADGTERWSFDTGSTVSGSPVVAGGTPEREGAPDGEETADDGTNGSAPDSSTVYVRTHDGTLYTIDAATGDGRVYFHTSGPQATTPTVHDGSVYVGIREYDSHSVAALDTEDGTEHWTVPFETPLQRAPVIADDVVIGVTETAYRERTISALDLVDGTERWSFNVTGTRNVSITATRGVVCIGTRTSLDGGTLFGLDAATGVRRWRFDNNGLAMAPVARDGTVYIVTETNELEALDPTGGQVTWARPVDFTVGPRPRVGDDTIVVSETSGGTIRALATEDGVERWTATLDGDVTGRPVIEDSTVYTIADREDGTSTLVSLNAADGRRRWTVDLPGRPTHGPFGGTGTISLVLAGPETDTLYTLDRADGTVRWEFDVPGRIRTLPQVADGVVYTAGDDGTVTAVDDDGTERWSFDTGHPVRRELAVSGGTVYVGSVDDLVYALDAKTGRVEWGYKNREPTSLSPTILQDSLYIGSESGHVHRLFGG